MTDADLFDANLFDAVQAILGPKATVRVSVSPKGGVVVNVGRGGSKLPHIMVWADDADQAIDAAMAAVGHVRVRR
jgi:hypothetical protein